MTFRYNASFHAGGENLMGVRSHAQALLVALRNNRTGILVIVLPSSLVVCNDVLSLVPTPFCFCVPYFGRISCWTGIGAGSQAKAYVNTIPGAYYQREDDKFWNNLSVNENHFLFRYPHRGARVLEYMIMVANYEIPENLRTVLKPRSNKIFAINDDFSDIKGKISVANLYEIKKTEKLGILVRFCVHD